MKSLIHLNDEKHLTTRERIKTEKRVTSHQLICSHLKIGFYNFIVPLVNMVIYMKRSFIILSF